MTTARYESREIKVELTKEDIHRRYQDTAMLIFQEQQSNRDMINYLTFGTSRRTIEYSNYGNDPIIIRRKPAIVSTTATTAALEGAGEIVAVRECNNNNIASRILKLYRKPSRDNCIII